MRPHSTTLCGRCRFLSAPPWDKLRCSPKARGAKKNRKTDRNGLGGKGISDPGASCGTDADAGDSAAGWGRPFHHAHLTNSRFRKSTPQNFQRI